MSSDVMEVTLKAYQVLEKTATNTGSSAHIFVPKEWAGKKVKVCLLEQISGGSNKIISKKKVNHSKNEKSI
jgi:putative transposon-encoded protein